MKKIPERSCIVCKGKQQKETLIRIVKNKSGEIQIDNLGKKDGRGAYICRDKKCIEKCIKNKILNRIFSAEVKEDIYERLKGEYIEKQS